MPLKSHGLSKSSIYHRWTGMKDRCLNPKNKKFPIYGGREIKVCDRWLKFENFLADMGHPPFKGASLDRIDSNGNYEPGNVRWTNQKTQQNNRTDNRWFEYRGLSLTVAQWAERINIRYQTLVQRLNRDRMSFEDAITRPLRPVKTSKRRMRPANEVL